MKKIISSIAIALLCLTANAQEKLNFFDYVEDMIGNKLSLSQFTEKYKPYFTEDYDKSTSSVTLKNLDIFGYEGASLTMFMPEYNVKIIAGLPDFEKLDSVSRYESAEKCHKEMTKLFGKPLKEEVNSYDDPMKQEIAKEMNMKGGVTYTWESPKGVLLTSSWTKTDKEDVYMVTFMTMELPSLTKTPIQRKFFRTLEFGKAVTKQQIAAATEINSLYISEERTSSGRTYNYWDKIYFGGIEWSFIEFMTVENKLSSVRFTHSHLKNNQNIFDSLFKALSEKYGDPTIEDNEACWIDGPTAIVLTYKYGESKGGEMRHDVDLRYADMQLTNEAQNIITNEL